MLKIFAEENGIIHHYIAGVRNANLQGDKHRMRRYMKIIAQIIGIELSKTLSYDEVDVETPLGIAQSKKLRDKIVLASILRAGLPLHEGLLEIYEEADSAFVGAYRKHHKDGTFEIESEYLSCGSLENKTLIMADAMLATGSSILLSLDNLIAECGKPKEIHIIAVIAARNGFNYVQRRYPNAHFWIGAMDEELTAKNYIVPGLGDAGDICYGIKSE